MWRTGSRRSTSVGAAGGGACPARPRPVWPSTAAVVVGRRSCGPGLRGRRRLGGRLLRRLAWRRLLGARSPPSSAVAAALAGAFLAADAFFAGAGVGAVTSAARRRASLRCPPCRLSAGAGGLGAAGARGQPRAPPPACATGRAWRRCRRRRLGRHRLGRGLGGHGGRRGLRRLLARPAAAGGCGRRRLGRRLGGRLCATGGRVRPSPPPRRRRRPRPARRARVRAAPPPPGAIAGTARSTLRRAGAKFTTTSVTASPTRIASRALRGGGSPISRSGT